MANLSTARRLWLNGKEIKVLSVNGNKCFERAPYQCEVEYLQSTGTQKIEFVNYGAGKETLVSMIYEQDSYQSSKHLFRSNSKDSSRRSIVAWFNGNSVNLSAGSSASTSSIFSQVLNKKNHLGVVFDDVRKVIYGSHNETSLPDGSFSGNIYDTYFGIFGGFDTSQFASFKLYKFTISLDGVAQHDFIPVLDWDDTPCLYDKVSGQLFYNAGTGAFLYGRRIYPQSYLYNINANAYINTGIKWQAGMGAKIKFSKADTTDRHIFGARTSSSEGMYFVSSYGDYSLNFGKGDTINLFNFSSVKNKVFEVEIAGDTFKVDGVDKGSFSGDGNPDLDIYLFTTNDNGTAHSQFLNGTIYYFQLTDADGNLLLDMIPASDEDKKAFMFDRKTHTIFDSANSNSFITSANL